MNEGFEGWVRVLCCGPLAYAAWMAAEIPNAFLAIVCGGLAVAFAIWPERMAYGYRKNRPLPFWSKQTSVVDPDIASDGSAAESFATYRPRLLNLVSAYFSVGWYVVFGFNLWRITPMHTPLLTMAGVASLLWLVSRSET